MTPEAQAILSRLNAVTIIACSIIVIVAVAFYVYLKQKEKFYKEILAKKLWIAQMPSMVSTLGVLGTFLGITIGLMHFNTEDLDTSIPLLLSGLKTAFLTSLLGMLGSLVLNRVVNRVMDDAENTEGDRKNQESTLNAVSNLISALDSKENKEFKKSIKDSTTALSSSIKSIADSLASMQRDLSQVKDDVEEIRGHCEEIKNATGALGASDNGEIPQLLAVVSTTAASIAKIDNDMDSVKDSSSSIMEIVQSISSDVEDLKQQ